MVLPNERRHAVDIVGSNFRHW